MCCWMRFGWNIRSHPEEIGGYAPYMLHPINLSAYADPILDELVSGEPKIDDTLFFDIIRQVQGDILELGCGYGRVTIPLAQRGITGLTGLE